MEAQQTGIIIYISARKAAWFGPACTYWEKCLIVSGVWFTYPHPSWLIDNKCYKQVSWLMSIDIFRLPGAPVAFGKKLQLQLRDSAGIPPASLLATCKKSAYNMKNILILL